MKTSEENIRSADIRRLSHNYSHVAKNKSDTTLDDVLIKGKFKRDQNSEGLSSHASEVTEMQNSFNMVELPAALSFNIIFEGKIDFTLGGNHYKIGHHLDNHVECYAFSLNRPETFTRFLKKGMHVRKVNVFVERQWLELRSHSIEDITELKQLFQDHSTLRHWQASPQVIHLANELSAVSNKTALKSKLETEYLTIKLLNQCIADFQADIAKTPSIARDTSTVVAKRDNELKQNIDKLLHNCPSLREIAQSLGLSISTLQRKFKAEFGITVNSYCRQRRLDIAKKALVVDGVSIGEAAYIAGYTHSSNFMSAFKKRFNQTPSEFIKYHHQR